MKYSDILNSRPKNRITEIITYGLWFAFILYAFCTFQPDYLNAEQSFTCLKSINPSDAILIAASDGTILYQKNGAKKCIPASTLKILTAVTAIHHLGLSFRFKTEFYTDPYQNLKIKGYGDPLLISEILQEITGVLTLKIQKFNDLILDDSYFSQNIQIPGVGKSTNPYDAPTGALCANFNTFCFDYDPQNRIISAEPQTPITPFASEKMLKLGLKKGRYTITHDSREAALYVGELFLHFMKQMGVKNNGEIRFGVVGPEDKLIFTYRSSFKLEDVLKQMMKFSNNFIANQILIAVGVHVHGPPGTLEKGLKVVSDYAKNELNLEGIEVMEGAGISRENRISALDMGTFLKQFKPHRHLLKRSGNSLIKTGTLKGISTRVGYIEGRHDDPYFFVIFLYGNHSDIDSFVGCIERILLED